MKEAKRSWITFSLLIAMLLVDLVLLGVYLALIVLAYLRARDGHLDYYYYVIADTIFAFVFALILTLTGVVFVTHERLVKAPEQMQEEAIELSELEHHIYLSIDFAPQIKATDTEQTDAPIATDNIPHLAHANFILHDSPILDSEKQLESSSTLKVSGETPCLLKPSRFTVKNSSEADISYKPFIFKQFVPLTPLSCVGMYVSSILFLLGITSFAWAIVIAQHYKSLSYKVGWTFAFVDFTSGILAPLLLLSSLTVCSFLLSYFTRQQLSLRSAITPLLSSVRLYMHPDGAEYWLVGRRFKYDLKDRRGGKGWFAKHPWVEAHYSTWAFWLVICLTILFSFSQFINLTVISEQTSSTCITDFDCFLAIRPFEFEHIICPTGPNNTVDITFMRNNSIALLPNNTLLYCFQYLDFGVDNNLFLALGSTYALYLFGIALFDRIFNVFAVLIQIKETRLWGVFLILIGAAGFVIILLLYFLNGLHTFLFDIIRFFEITQFSAYMIVMGVLALAYFHQDGMTGAQKKQK